MKLAGLFVLGVICAAQAGPLSPQEERGTFHLADDSLTAELVAAEPNVLSPVAIAWDARGRLFVAEMIDYPLGPGSGQVRMLEDLNHDGYYEKAVVFAGQLPFPNGVLPWKEGLLVTSAPNILFLKDSDGDGRADVREVILTGFAEGNQQLRVNGLLWGLDGWVYGANGRSDGDMRRPGDAKAVSLRGHDFRFLPETGAFEVIAGRSQFGVARDDWGNRFLSWNTIAIRQEVIPERYLARNPNIPVTEAVHDLAPPGDKGEVFPLTEAPKTFNSESTSHFNALAGLTIYRGDALPARYKGNAFMGETLRNLVHRRVLEPDGPSFVARRGEQGKDFLASTDPWFHPVNFATGPDGALYVVDFYREWVEHPGYVPEKFRGEFAWRTGAEHGRIWRVRPRAWKRSRHAEPGLTDAPASRLVSNLRDPNGWRRDTATRLLMERKEFSAIPPLQRFARNNNNPEGSIHALHALERLGGLDDVTLASALKSRKARVQENALRLIETRLGNSLPWVATVSSLVEARDAAVRLWAALVLGNAEVSRRIGPLAMLAIRDDLDPITSTAIRAGVSDRPWLFLESIQSIPSRRPVFLELIRALAGDVGRGNGESDLSSLMKVVRSATTQALNESHLALYAGFCHGLAGTGNRSAAQLEAQTASKLISFALEVASRPEVSSVARDSAVQTLVCLARSETSPTILNFLLPPREEPLQTAAAKALVAAADPVLFGKALQAWDRYQIKTRRELLSGAVRSIDAAALLVGTMEHGNISPTELDASTRQNLLRLPSDELKARLQKVLGQPVSLDREEVIKEFAAAARIKGDQAKGRAVFEKACIQCHSVGGQGGAVGPILSGIGSRTRETLLIDILDPNRQVNPEFVSYSVVTRESETITGLLVSDNRESVTLRRPNFPDETIPRSRIDSVQAGKISLMPEGLEAGLTPQDVADLLEFLSNPG